MEIVKKDNVQFLVSEKIKALHGFTLRSGGVSCGDFDSLNVGLRRGDNPFNAMKNIEICCDKMGLNKGNLTLTYQTHTNNVRFVTENDIGKGFIREWGEGVDGIVTNLKNVPIMCYSADCVPTLLYDGVNHIIGAIHGGWRGTKENIIKNAIQLMCRYGSLEENITAFIGPAIGICCYEVSEDVAQEFSDYKEAVKEKENGKYLLDLKKITQIQLEQAGVMKENIENSHICTCCKNDLFFSHRKQKGKSGLLGGFIQMI
ncbi:MAG: peptidoglycan editing factor PgeF [Clostridia bacterium]